MEPQTERKALGQVIRALRELEGLSREELGGKADLGVDMIAKIEQGAKAPSAGALKRIASALGLDPIDLSNRGLLWAAMKDSPESSTALLRNVATGADAFAFPALELARGMAPAAARAIKAAPLPASLIAGAAGAAGVAGLAYLKDKTSKSEIKAALRKRLEERMEQAPTEEDLARLAIAIETVTPETPPIE